jgi:thymidylate kinase
MDRAAPIVIVTGPSGAGKTTVGRLVAGAFDRSVHLGMDDFIRFVVNGWADPSLPESAHQNRVLGGAVAIAAMHFAEDAYTVVVDGCVFPDAVEEFAAACSLRGVPLHYAVLRTDLATCIARVARRRSADADDRESLARVHRRFADLGDHEDNVIDASGPPDQVAAALLTELAAGRLAKISSRSNEVSR